jgi:diguanylate cyclase (GGDEF)-like protein
MLNYKELYEKLKDEFETYQNFAETNIAILNEKNTKLEKNLDSLTNIVEISKYINSYLSHDNLIPMINDMIIGILGVTYSSISLDKHGELIVQASNKKLWRYDAEEQSWYKELFNGEPFLINSKTNIFLSSKEDEEIHSLIGVPIKVRDNLIGYIIEEHKVFGFFDYNQIKFISSIANQIAIALENNFLYNKIKESSLRDPLLGLYNRKYFYSYVEKEIYNKPGDSFAIVMVDIDDFKKINDNYGHQYGDKVLVSIANSINNNLDKEDLIARYGGEEIVLYIHEAKNKKGVYSKIDKIRMLLGSTIVRYREIEERVTASFGISFYPQDGISIEEVVKTADDMLYKAKGNGKNRVEITNLSN